MAQQKSLSLSVIGQIAMGVKDLDRAVAFYRDQLSMKYLFQAGELMAFFDCSGVRLMLTLSEDGSDHTSSSILYYKVDDIDGAYERLRADNVQLEGEPHMIAELEDHDLWMAFFRDSEANLLALMEERPRN